MGQFIGKLIEEQAQKWAYDRQAGDMLVRSWRGSDIECRAAYYELKKDPNVLSVELDPDQESPVSSVVARFGQIQQQAETDGSVPYVWELAGNMIELSVLNHPKFKSDETIPDPNPNNIKLTDQQKNEVKSAFLNIDTTPNPDVSTWNVTQKQLWNLLVNGVESYVVSSWVFRLIRTFSSNFSTTVPVDNVGKVYTFAQIQDEANNVINAPISNAVAANVPSTGEWLKQAPTIAEISNKKVQWTQEWWYAQDWSNILYDNKT